MDLLHHRKADELLKSLDCMKRHYHEQFLLETVRGSHMWKYFIDLMKERIEGFHDTDCVRYVLRRTGWTYKMEALLHIEFDEWIEHDLKDIAGLRYCLFDMGIDTKELEKSWCRPNFLYQWGDIIVKEIKISLAA